MTGIVTLIQKEEFKNCLEILNSTLFEKKNTFQKTLENKVQAPYSEIIKAKMVEHEIKYTEQWKIKELIEKLILEIKGLRTMNLTLAFVPNESTLKKIDAWIKNNLKSNLVIDIKIDPALIGGAIISVKGHYSDQSLKRKINKVSIKNLVKENYGNV